MNEFITKMLQLGAELATTDDQIETNVIINDAEILYEKERKEIRNEIKNK